MIEYGHDKQGGFYAIDEAERIAYYAYSSSPNADTAKSHVLAPRFVPGWVSGEIAYRNAHPEFDWEERFVRIAGEFRSKVSMPYWIPVAAGHRREKEKEAAQSMTYEQIKAAQDSEREVAQWYTCSMTEAERQEVIGRSRLSMASPRLGITFPTSASKPFAPVALKSWPSASGCIPVPRR